MKKIIALLLAVLMSVAVFAGCGGNGNAGSSSNSDKTDSSSSEQKADANSDWGFIQNKGSLKIGITYFEPMNYMKDGKLTGFETEFAEAVCAELGVKAEFQEIEWDSKEVELNSKTIDCIWNGLTITDERKNNMDISTPYMANKQVMIVKAENAEKYATAEGVKGAKVIAEAGSAGEEVAKGDEFFKEAKYTPADSQAKALLEVKSGTSDIAIIDYVMSIGTLKAGSDYADLKIIESKSFSPEEYGIAFRKNSPQTLEKVNAAIKTLAENGKLAEIADKYSLKEQIIAK